MKILIPLDGSKFAEDVLGPASQLASLSKEIIEVHLIRVVDTSKSHTTWRRPPPTPADGGVSWGIESKYFSPVDFGSAVAVETMDQEKERVSSEAQDYLKHIAHQFFPRSSVTKVILGGEPAEDILAYARTEEVDLIAIATHGRTGLARVLLGSVAQKLLKAYVAPLFMVRPKALGETAAAAEADDRSSAGG